VYWGAAAALSSCTFGNNTAGGAGTSDGGARGGALFSAGSLSMHNCRCVASCVCMHNCRCVASCVCMHNCRCVASCVCLSGVKRDKR
jgi:hypothetical protein